MISGFRGEYRWLSNFWPSPINIDGVSYPTVEHFYQSEKTLSPLEKAMVMMCETPGAAKRVGGTITLTPDWPWRKFMVMASGIAAKFTSITSLGDALLATGNKQIVEANRWHDTYWGVCTCAKHNGAGENVLGEILMSTRKTLRSLTQR